MKKKIIALLTATLMCSVVVFTGCDSCSDDPNPSKQDKVVVTNLGLEQTTGVVKKPSADVEISIISDGKVVAQEADALSYNKAFIANSADSVSPVSSVANVKVGDIINITSDYTYIKLEMLGMEPVVIYSPTGEFVYQIPATGTPNWQTPYASGTFSKSTNLITATVATDEEIAEERNLALNPYDFMYKSEITVESTYDQTEDGTVPVESKAVEAGEVVSFPHAYGNRITTGNNRPSFLARNAIDGSVTTGGNLGHINYGAHSWGGGRRPRPTEVAGSDWGFYDDLTYTVYFGREVKLTELAFVMRADYTGTKEHDTNFTGMTAEFSDGSEQVLTGFQKGADMQVRTIDTVKTTYVRLKDFTRDFDENTSEGWTALTEFEARGVDNNVNSAATKTTTKNTFGGKKIEYTTDVFSAEEVREIVDFASNDAPAVVKAKNSSGVSQNWWRDTVLYSALMDAYTTTGNLDSYLYIRNAADKYKYTMQHQENGRGQKSASLSTVANNFAGYSSFGQVTDFADNYLAGETYLWLNELRPVAYKTFNTFANADANMLNKPSWSTNFNTGANYSNGGSGGAIPIVRPLPANILDWWWCDAIYMGLNSFTLMSNLTEDDTYIEKAFRSYEHWRGVLACRDNHTVGGTSHGEDWGLWHRDTDNANYRTNKQINSAAQSVPTFWGRGNAWVFAALAKQLLYVNETYYSEIYETYVEDFKMMAKTLKDYQRDDGAWRPSIIDPSHKDGKESTGSSGFVYGIAVGVQLGILPADEYMPVVEKGFNALLDMRQDSGRMGYMQDVGYDAAGYPGESSARTAANAFGYGLFIHAAAAVMRLCSDYEAPVLSVPADAQFGAARLPEYAGVKS